MSMQVIRFLPYALAFIGVVSRLYPVGFEERLYLQFPNDDGYYMLTMARNMALGLGMSVSMGEVPTNGTQPLITGVYAILYWLAGADKALGLQFVHLFLTACACASTYLLYNLAQDLLPRRPWTKLVSAWLAAFWFCSPATLSLSMNALETGPLVLVLLAFLKVFLALTLRPFRQQTLAQWAGIGVLLGLLFWIRNDTIFIVAAVACQRLILVCTAVSTIRRTLLLQAGIVVSVSGAIALPWVAFNYFEFGYLMPISGMAEAGMRPGALSNVVPALRAMAITMYAVVPGVPIVLRVAPDAVPISVAIALTLTPFAVWARWVRGTWPMETTGIAFVVLVYGGILVLYYTFFFGAAWSLIRFFFPLTPLLGIFVAGVAGVVATRSRQIPMRTVAVAGVVSMLILVFGMGWRVYSTEAPPHELSEWVAENVPSDVWVGAYQSGMVGYLHDRTINLDGKVDPGVYEARRAGTLRDFLVRSPVEYILDWPDNVMADIEYLEHNFLPIVIEEGIVVFRRNPASSSE